MQTRPDLVGTWHSMLTCYPRTRRYSVPPTSNHGPCPALGFFPLASLYLYNWSPVLPLVPPSPGAAQVTGEACSPLRCPSGCRVRACSAITSWYLCVQHFTQATSRRVLGVSTGASPRRRGPEGMPELRPSRASGGGACIRKQQHWGPGAATRTRYLVILRRKTMLSPLLMPWHYYTMVSSSLCSHYQLPDFFYILSSNYVEEKILSVQSSTEISTEVCFPTAPSTGHCLSCRHAVLCGDRLRVLWPEWQVHWAASWWTMVEESHKGVVGGINVLISKIVSSILFLSPI